MCIRLGRYYQKISGVIEKICNEIKAEEIKTRITTIGQNMYPVYQTCN